jgi:hypothetical protein
MDFGQDIFDSDDEELNTVDDLNRTVKRIYEKYHEGTRRQVSDLIGSLSPKLGYEYNFFDTENIAKIVSDLIFTMKTSEVYASFYDWQTKVEHSPSDDLTDIINMSYFDLCCASRDFYDFINSGESFTESAKDKLYSQIQSIYSNLEMQLDLKGTETNEVLEKKHHIEFINNNPDPFIFIIENFSKKHEDYFVSLKKNNDSYPPIMSVKINDIDLVENVTSAKYLAVKYEGDRFRVLSLLALNFIKNLGLSSSQTLSFPKRNDSYELAKEVLKEIIRMSGKNRIFPFSDSNSYNPLDNKIRKNIYQDICSIVTPMVNEEVLNDGGLYAAFQGCYDELATEYIRKKCADFPSPIVKAGYYIPFKYNLMKRKFLRKKILSKKQILDDG